MTKTKYMTLENIAYTLTHKHSKDAESIIEKCDSKYLDGSLDRFITALSGIKDIQAQELVFNASETVLDHSSEATQFMNDLDLFAKAFDMSCSEQTRSKRWDKLLKVLSDKKLQYDIMGCFMNKASENEYGQTTDKMFKLRATSPYATPYDIFVFCTVYEESGESSIFKQGLKKFNQAFEQEIKKTKPNFSELKNAADMVREYIQAYPDNINTPEFYKLVECTEPALEMRIRIAMLEKENKKLKAELRAKKTTNLKKGIANVAGKTKIIKGDSKQR